MLKSDILLMNTTFSDNYADDLAGVIRISDEETVLEI